MVKFSFVNVVIGWNEMQGDLRIPSHGGEIDFGQRDWAVSTCIEREGAFEAPQKRLGQLQVHEDHGPSSPHSGNGSPQATKLV